MSLKQSIVIVNEFTYKTASGEGTRGSSPGDYVTRYMLREGATEQVAPTKLRDNDHLLTKYEGRMKAVHAETSIPGLKRRMKKAERLGGIAFSNGNTAMSDESVRSFSKMIQSDFDNGKTVLKTVLSFDEDWLREHGILEEDFVLKRKGDFRGHIDQLKLRLAVMHGVERMAVDFDDLHYIGCIQVDTKHVHVHLAMVDRGVGHVRPDGLQRGKLTSMNKKKLRRGMDMYLDQKQTVKAMSSSIMYDKRNAICYIKKFAHQTLAKQGLPQFLLACLPADRRLWRASTHRKEMRKANTLVREYVTELLNSPRSGYDVAIADITKYADYRKKREGLSNREYEKLIHNGREQLISDCMNGVYAVLKQIPKEELVVRTPMLDVMSMDYDALASQAVDNPIVEFGLKLRSYSSRLRHHRSEYHKYRDEYRNYEAAEQKSEDSKALGDYLKIERDYNAMCMVKYQYFLSFLPPDEHIEDDFAEILRIKALVESLKQMRDDPAFDTLSADAAEEYGLQVYQQTHGRFIKSVPHHIQDRIDRFENSLLKKEFEFQDKLRDAGLDYDGHGVIRRKMYPFDVVKALDLHHLGYDFPYDTRISKVNVDKFKKMADSRYRGFQSAKDYLVRSGQSAALSILPEQDVVFMKQYADELSGTDTIATVRSSAGQYQRPKTVRLGKDYVSSLENVVKSTVRSLELDDVELE